MPTTPPKKFDPSKLVPPGPRQEGQGPPLDPAASTPAVEATTTAPWIAERALPNQPDSGETLIVLRFLLKAPDHDRAWVTSH